MFFQGEKRRGMAKKWERLNGIRSRQRESNGQCMCKEHSTGLVKKIKWVRIKEKYKYLAKSNKHYRHTSETKTK